MKPVPGIGPKTCIMALVGEAPGRDEEIDGRPFIGHAGNILNGKLHRIGLARQDCYVTNLCKFRPGTLYNILHALGEEELSITFGSAFAAAAKGVKKPKDDNDFQMFWTAKRPSALLNIFRDSLLKELDEINTNIIVALGASAMWALTGESAISKWRGTVTKLTLPSGREVKVIPTYHPAAILRQWSMGAVMEFDLQKALKESKTSELVLPERELLIAPTFDDIVNFDKGNYTETCFDIETSMNSITCISFAHSKDRAISIPTTKHYWGSYSKLKSVLEHIEYVMSKPGVEKVAQNITYDVQWMMRHWGILPTKPWFDTMIAQHACYSEMPKSLAFLNSIYTDEPYYKDDLKVWNEGQASDELLWQYNAKDAATTLEIKHALESEMTDLGTRHVYDFMIELLDPLLYIMMRGMRVDKEAIDKHREDYENSMTERLERFNNKYPGVNPHSAKQVMNLAYNTLKLKPIIKKGKQTCDANAVKKLAKKHPVMADIKYLRSDRTNVSNFLEDKTDSYDGRLRFSLNSTGTETGRLSSSAHAFWCGRNMQNQPKKLRNIIIPDPGNMFTEADLAGADARVVIYECCDPIGIKLIETCQNIHKYTACNILWPNISEEDVEEDKEKCDAEGRDTESKYFIAKKIRHGANYKMGPKTTADVLGWTMSQAKNVLAMYYNLSPNLVKWHRSVMMKLEKDRTIITPLGRPRIFFGRMGDEILKEALAYIPQETVGKVINTGIINIYKEYKNHVEIHLVNQVHDSVLIEHPIEMKDELHTALPELMRVSIPWKEGEYEIPIDITSGMNWRDMK